MGPVAEIWEGVAHSTCQVAVGRETREGPKQGLEGELFFLLHRMYMLYIHWPTRPCFEA